MKILSFSFLTRLLLISLTLNSCSKRYDNLPAFSSLPVFDAKNESVGRFKTSYIAEQIHAFFRGTNPGPIAITTFANLDSLDSSSSFGRILSEQLISELAMIGYQVIEIRQSESLHFDDAVGELNLSRLPQELRQSSQKLGAIVVGTYAVSPERVMVNARLLDPKTSVVVSVGSVEMPKTDEISYLLHSGSYQMSLERIPVRYMPRSPGHNPFMPSAAPYNWQDAPSAAHTYPKESQQTTKKSAPSKVKHSAQLPAARGLPRFDELAEEVQ